MFTPPGTILGNRFELGDEQLARMEPGEIRLARDLHEPGRPVEITLAPTTPQGFGRSLAALKAGATGGHEHPHILALLGSGEVGELAWIATEQTVGASLRDRLEREGRMAPATAIRCARQMLAALVHIHDRGALHGNLAPSRVVLDAAGDVRLTGFPDPSFDEFPDGVMIITPAYAAPARIEGGPADVAGDLWTVGAMLYQMLTEERPFGGTNFAAIRTSVLTTSPTPPSHLAPVPAALDAVLARALARDPAARFPDARAFDAALAATAP